MSWSLRSSPGHRKPRFFLTLALELGNKANEKEKEGKSVQRTPTQEPQDDDEDRGQSDGDKDQIDMNWDGMDGKNDHMI